MYNLCQYHIILVYTDFPARKTSAFSKLSTVQKFVFIIRYTQLLLSTHSWKTQAHMHTRHCAEAVHVTTVGLVVCTWGNQDFQWVHTLLKQKC